MARVFGFAFRSRKRIDFNVLNRIHPVSGGLSAMSAKVWHSFTSSSVPVFGCFGQPGGRPGRIGDQRLGLVLSRWRRAVQRARRSAWASRSSQRMAQRHDPPAQGLGRDRFVRRQRGKREKAVIARRIVKRCDFRLASAMDRRSV